MVTCKDCVHFEVCRGEYAEGIEQLLTCDGCEDFKDRSRFIELPTIDDYEEVKLLDIAIDYCYKVAMSSDPNICTEYKAEHMRICGWLGDLRRRIEAEQTLKRCNKDGNL